MTVYKATFTNELGNEIHATVKGKKSQSVVFSLAGPNSSMTGEITRAEAEHLRTGLGSVLTSSVRSEVVAATEDAMDTMGLDLNNSAIAAMTQALGHLYETDPDQARKIEQGIKAAIAPDDSGPHIQVEYDTSYYGGGYSDVGSFAYIPVSVLDAYQSTEDAFQGFTGIDKRHIIHYDEETHYTSEGDIYEEEED